jgi:hypothetical protein
MRTIFLVAALAFALIAATTMVMTVHPQHAIADCGTGNC